MKNVLITGVSGNLGSQLAAHFLEAGDRVLGLDIREREDFGADEERFVFSKCDLRDPEAVEAVISDLVETHGAMDVVINNAGLLYNSPLLRFENGSFLKHDFDKWREVIDVTLSSAFYVSACAAQAMISRAKQGVIVNVSSICAGGNLGQPAYSAAKSGINGLTAALAKELGPLGVRVAAVAPGYIDTESTRDHVPEAFLDQIRKRTPTRKLGSVAQFISAIDFVIANAYFNGKVLEVDGGLTLK